MLSQQEQMNQFILQIMEDVNRETGGLLKTAEQTRLHALAETENRLLSEAFAQIQASAADCKREAGREIAARVFALRQEEASRRTQMKDEVLALVRERVAAFAASPGYEAALRRQAAEAAEAAKTIFAEGAFTVLLRAQDMAFAPALAAFFPEHTGFAPGPHVFGGLVVQGPFGRTVMDFSFDGRLAEIGEQFSLFVRLDCEEGAKK